MASRMPKTPFVWVILIITSLALVGGNLSCDSSLLSQKAPDFTLPTLTGANITLSELEGTPLVLNFWATNCPHCVTELHYFEAVAQEGGGGIKAIAINVGQPISEIERFFGDYEPTMTVPLDMNGDVFRTYSLEDNPGGYIPITFLVDSQGIVQYIKIGAFETETELRQTLNDVCGTTIP